MAANRMSRFEIFIGIWNTTGEVLETESAAATDLSAGDGQIRERDVDRVIAEAAIAARQIRPHVENEGPRDQPQGQEG